MKRLILTFLIMVSSFVYSDSYEPMIYFWVKDQNEVLDSDVKSITVTVEDGSENVYLMTTLSDKTPSEFDHVANELQSYSVYEVDASVQKKMWGGWGLTYWETYFNYDNNPDYLFSVELETENGTMYNGEFYLSELWKNKNSEIQPHICEGLSVNSSVPEPNSLLLLLIGASCLALRRRLVS